MNRGFDYVALIPADAAGNPLADHLAQCYPHSTRATWIERIDAGRVLLDDRPAQRDEPVRAGQRLTWRRPPWQEPAAPVHFSVLFEDRDLLAVAKPAGLPTLPGGNFLESTLLAAVGRRYPDAAPLHRLGRFTSGLVLCARSLLARRRLAADWRDGRVEKSYRALAQGRARRERFTVDVRIGPVDYPPLGTLNAATPNGKAALSTVRVLEQREDSFLAAVRIVTGRPHQIRIHLAAAGHPLVGDSLFVEGGRPDPRARALPGDGGYLLHSRSLRVTHPRSGKELGLSCEVPAALSTRAELTLRGSTASSSDPAPT